MIALNLRRLILATMLVIVNEAQGEERRSTERLPVPNAATDRAGGSILLAQGVAPAPRNVRAELDSMHAAAKAEGELLFYTTTPENVAKRTADAFFSKYGIRAAFLRIGGSSPLQTRYAAEAESANIAADLIMNAGGSSITYAEMGIKRGWAESISEASLPVIKSGEFPAKFNMGPTAIIQISPWLIVYNTDKVKGGDIPKDWTDLLNPKWKGQIILPNPTVSDTYIELWGLLLDKYGESFFTRLRAQNPRVMSAGITAVQGLAAGEASFVLPQIPSSVTNLKEKGAPIEMATLDYTTGVEIHVMLTSRAKARHPSAARLFADYVMSLEGNKIVNADPGGMTVYDTTRLAKDYQSPKPATTTRKDQIAKLLGL